MRTIKHIHKPENDPIQDLVTYRVLPTRSISYVDPFLFLNHHGPQVYQPNNSGLPFGPHPHRGMETVTFILEGDIVHFDNNGHKSVINSGGVQWMRAGKGLIHSEVSSPEFKMQGGPLEILQLWVNLPARSKMAEPYYEGLQEQDIPTVRMDDGKVKAQLIFGEWEGKKAAFVSDIGLQLSTLYFQKDGKLFLNIQEEENLFFYLVRGKMTVNGKP
ncbi:MAG TPA: pirin family protein, partial [Sunxiuqinia sp.]|nr:pirin family protein [Sunxiuqinia sp.]